MWFWEKFGKNLKFSLNFFKKIAQRQKFMLGIRYKALQIGQSPATTKYPDSRSWPYLFDNKRNSTFSSSKTLDNAAGPCGALWSPAGLQRLNPRPPVRTTELDSKKTFALKVIYRGSFSSKCQFLRCRRSLYVVFFVLVRWQRIHLQGEEGQFCTFAAC